MPLTRQARTACFKHACGTSAQTRYFKETWAPCDIKRRGFPASHEALWGLLSLDGSPAPMRSQPLQGLSPPKGSWGPPARWTSGRRSVRIRPAPRARSGTPVSLLPQPCAHVGCPWARGQSQNTSVAANWDTHSCNERPERAAPRDLSAPAGRWTLLSLLPLPSLTLLSQPCF